MHGAHSQESGHSRTVHKAAEPWDMDFITTACGGDGLEMARRICAVESANRANPVARFVFGNCSRYHELQPVLLAGGARLAWLRGDTAAGAGISAIQSFAVLGTDVNPIRRDGLPLGFVYEDDHARYCRVCGVLPDNPAETRDAQTRNVLGILAEALADHGFRFTDTVRTWFYLDRLLDWYGAFNEVRTAFFRQEGVLAGTVPASTGIGAGNPAGAALTADLLAIRPKTNAVRIHAVPSPLQCPATRYDSSFSRAVEVEFPEWRRLFVSGTASIDPDGRTACANDPDGQIRLTMRVVERLLQSRGMGWQDVTRGIAYFKLLADRPLFEACCGEQGIPELPLAMAEAAICRPDLDFEIELDAFQGKQEQNPIPLS